MKKKYIIFNNYKIILLGLKDKCFHSSLLFDLYIGVNVYSITLFGFTLQIDNTNKI